MSVVLRADYQGQKRVKLLHEHSGASFVTDAPLDNHGLAQSFSPTDLIAAGLGSCILTVMGIVAERKGYDLGASYARIDKEMQEAPRRIGRITVEIHMPAALAADARAGLERVADTCPVKASLHPDVRINVVFQYDA